MPLTDAQKQTVLGKLGYAPFEADLVEQDGGFAVVPLNTQPHGFWEAASKMALTKIPRTAANVIGGTTAAAVAAPASAAAASGAGGLTAATGVGAPAAPFVAGATGLLASGAAYMGGAKIADAAYDATLKKSIDDRVYENDAQRARDEAEHPYLATGMDLGAMIASMKFNDPRQAVGAVAKLAKLGMLARGDKVAMTAKDLEALKHVGNNVIGNTLVSAWDQHQHGEIDPKRLAFDAATGLMFGAPRGVLGVPAAGVEKFYDWWRTGRKLGAPMPPGPPIKAPVQAEVGKSMGDPVADAQARAERAGLDWEHYYEQAANRAQSPQETAANFVSNIDAALANPQTAKRRSPVESVPATKPVPGRLFPRGYELPGMNPEQATPRIPADLSESVAPTELGPKLSNMVLPGLNPAPTQFEFPPGFSEWSPSGHSLKPFGPQQPPPEKNRKARLFEDYVKRNLNPDNMVMRTPASNPPETTADYVSGESRHQDLPPNYVGAPDPTDRAALERRGFPFQEQAGPVKGRASGAFDRGTGQITVSNTHTQPDTFTHEGIHAELWDMLQSPNPKVRKAAMDILEAAHNEKNGPTPDNLVTEEAIVKLASDASRTQRGANALLRTIKDNWNWFRTTKLGGGDVTPERMARILAERFDYIEPGGGKAGGEGRRFQDLAPISQVPSSVLAKAAEVDKRSADAASRMFNERDMLLGKVNHLVDELQKHPKDIVQSAIWKRSRAGQLGTAPQFTPEEAAVNAVYQKLMDVTAQEATAAGYPINQTANYVPEHTGTQAVRDYESQGGAARYLPELHKLNQAVYGSSYDPIDGESYLRNYLAGVAKAPNSLGSDFGALTKSARQYHLPDSLREQDMVENVRRYANRWATGVAKKKHILNDPYVAARLGYDSQGVVYPSGAQAQPEITPQLRNLRMAIDDVLFNQGRGSTGIGQNTRDLVMAGQQVVNSAVMQTLTAVKNTILAGPMHMISAQNPEQAAALLSGTLRSIIDYHVQYAKARGSNVIKPNIDPAFDLSAPLSLQIARNVREFGTSMRKYTVGEFFETYNRVRDYTIGEELAKVNIPLAQKGDAAAKRFLEQFGAGADTTQPMPEQVARIARNYAKGIQGTYGPEGLPATMLTGSPIAHMLRIQRFGVENLGRVRQMVINPARQGDYRPLIAYTLGLVLTAPLVQKVSEIFTGRPSGLPTDAEIKAGNQNHLVEHILNIMSMAQITGAFGIGGNLAGGVAQNWRGNRQQLIGDPAINLGIDVLNNTGMAAQAVANGEPVFPVFMELMKRSLIDNMQLGRTLVTDREEAQDTRNKRVYEYQSGSRDVSAQDRLAGMLMGNMLSGRTPQISPTKEAARDGDPAALAKLTPAQISSLDNYRGGYEDPEKEAQYMGYLLRTQGEPALRAYVERRRKHAQPRR